MSNIKYSNIILYKIEFHFGIKRNNDVVVGRFRYNRGDSPAICLYTHNMTSAHERIFAKFFNGKSLKNPCPPRKREETRRCELPGENYRLIESLH